MADCYAHSLPGRPHADWEMLPDHLDEVARYASENASAFGFAAIAHLAGLIHDIGKYSAAFQAYLLALDDIPRGPDHSTAGAVEASRLYQHPVGRMLAFIIAGHHAGLADGTRLDERLKQALDPYVGWEQQVGALPESKDLAGRLRRPSPHKGFSICFLIRMLFSCLVDADFVATERFYASAEGRSVARGGFTPLPELQTRLQDFLRKIVDDDAPNPTPVNILRAEILAHAVGKAALAPGLFTLTVPTGGGKTLTSLSFALEHAIRHGLRRVIYVIPFTSIIEQTADVFRGALAASRGARNGDDVLEHHATFDWDAATGDTGRGSDAADRLRRAAENWAAPIVVTTAVQFFESLFASRTSRCRKLHNIASSVIVLDEAQTLPLPLLRPCLAALDELARNYGATVVLCTATQPALRVQDGFLRRDERLKVESGLDIPDDREIAPDPPALYTRLQRVTVERLDGATNDDVIASRFAAQPRLLCIVNTRAHAQALFTRLKRDSLPGALHLSTLMCPAHRRQVLATARQRLKDGEPVRLVSTSLIEAGVDIDFPEVWRAAAGLDSIAQAAGRCNREGAPTKGRVVVFEAADRKPPHALMQTWQAGRAVLRHTDDPLGLDAVRTYFQTLYWQAGADALDAATLDTQPFPILQEIAKRAPQRNETNPALAFPFASIATAFRMIDDVMEPVVVPWRAGPDDRTCETILGRVAAMDRPLGPDLRRLQSYVVGVPRKARDEWLRLKVLQPVNRALGEALLRFDGLTHYDAKTGVHLSDTLERSVADNLF